MFAISGNLGIPSLSRQLFSREKEIKNTHLHTAYWAVIMHFVWLTIANLFNVQIRSYTYMVLCTQYIIIQYIECSVTWAVRNVHQVSILSIPTPWK